MVTTSSQLATPEGLRRAVSYLPDERWPLIESAYRFAEEAHAGQTRLSGEPYIQHPLHAALEVARLQMDAGTIAAALLHDVVEDCDVSLETLEGHFGSDVRRLVDGVTKLSRITFGPTDETKRRSMDDEAWLESLRKMFVAMAEDLRVVVIKLADRLHNMETLSAMEPTKQRIIAQETRDIYAPLAARLNVWEFYSRLEDLAFRYLEPERYADVERLVVSRRVPEEAYIERAITALRQALADAGLKNVEVSGRAKHLYSVWQKMQRYAAQGKGFEDIYDLVAVRVIVGTLGDCYAGLGVIHQMWPPLPGQFDDYIATPKNGLYQSLHTSVIALEGHPLEIQIRTKEMHQVAEYGVAAHWVYKDGVRPEERVAWLRQLLEWQRDLSGSEEFLESVKEDIFADQVFVYTPKGDIKELPAGSTPIDFAYRVHTELGHRCIGAKVSGRLVPLNYKLQNGDVVEILAAKGERGPSRDWLNPHFGYIATTSARTKVRQWFRRVARGENVALGKQMLERELRRLTLPFAKQDELAKLFKYDNLEEFYQAIGIGEVSLAQIGHRLAPPERPEPEPAVAVLPRSGAPEMRVLGVGDLLTRLARCCNPVPGDPIIGFITRGRGVTVHRADCPNVGRADEEERVTSVAWGESTERYVVALRIEAWDRVGLLRDVTNIIAGEAVNLRQAVTRVHSNQTATVMATLEVKDLQQLERIRARLQGLRSVIEVSRAADEGASTR
jgi:guanosine-3',5'-bis(diphosphate) 3'-pyrophosphohydrolase